MLTPKRSCRAASGLWAFLLCTLPLAGCRSRPAPGPRLDTSALVAALHAAQQPNSAVAGVLLACGPSGTDCRCAETAARAGLDAALPDLTLQLLGRAPKACPNETQLAGERAEALARAKDPAARDAANSVLKSDPKNPYAELALAHVIYNNDNKMGETSEHAQKALEFGRGPEADRLLGRSALARSLYKDALYHFEKVLTANPNDAEAAFSVGVCADKLDNYRQAREAFLQTLRINPQHKQARIYLILLTHNVGANAEARHHLAKLAELLPKGDPQLEQLTNLLDATADGGSDAGAHALPMVHGVIQGKH